MVAIISNWLSVRVFANSPGDRGSIPGQIIPKTQKMVLDAYLLNTQQYKVCIKGKVKQSRERSSAFPYTLVLQLLKGEPSGHPRLTSPTLLYLLSFFNFCLNFIEIFWILILFKNKLELTIWILFVLICAQSNLWLC